MSKAIRDTVEDDLILGPLYQEEIFSKVFGLDAPEDSEADQVHILVRVFKYRVFVEQYDTSDQVWYLVGESFHDIQVEIARCIIDRKFKTHNPKKIVRIIRERFGGPYAVHRFADFCRSTAWDFTIHESGPQRDNLIRRMYSDQIGNLCLCLCSSKV